METTKISSTFFIAGRDLTKFAIVSLSRIVAALKLLSINWVDEAHWALSVSASHYKFSRSMAEKFVAPDLDLVRILSVFIYVIRLRLGYILVSVPL